LLPHAQPDAQNLSNIQNRRRSDNLLEYTADGKLYRGSLIKQKRRETHIEIEELAEFVNYSSSMIRRVENNSANTSKKLIKAIAKGIGVSEEELSQAPVHPRINRRRTDKPQNVEAVKTIFHTQVEQIMDKSGLSQTEREYVEHIIVDFTRSVCLGLKEMRIKEQLGRNTETLPSN